jgi:single-strand DNA-binding protein
MLNQCQFIGNLGADPEVRSFANGGRVCNLRLAVTEKWKDRTSGERKERTEWISIAVFGDGLVGVAERYLRKGSKVFVQGELRSRKWQTQDGQDRYSVEVVLQGPGAVLTMLDGPQNGAGGQANRNDDRPAQNDYRGDDSDIPF